MMLGKVDRITSRCRANLGHRSPPLLAGAWGRAGALAGVGLSVAVAILHYLVFGLCDLEEPAASAQWLSIVGILTLGYALWLVPSSMLAVCQLPSDHNNNLFRWGRRITDTEPQEGAED
jgi:hypothetical protein